MAGGTACAAGLLLKFGSGVMESEVLTLLNNIQVDGTPIGTLADANVYLMIVGGVFVMVIGVLGLCGAWNSIKECLWAVSTINKSVAIKGCTAYCLNFSEFQKNQLLLQIFPKIDKRMKFPKVMFSVNVVVSFV